jgi:adenosylhomocysteine nucleosidase
MVCTYTLLYSNNNLSSGNYEICLVPELCTVFSKDQEIIILHRGMSQMLRSILCAISYLVVSNTASAASPDTSPRTLVISAFGPEWSAMQVEMTGVHTFIFTGVTYLSGRLRGQDVVLFRSGVSVVNAAMTTQAAIDHFDVRRIVFSGVAGGVDPGLSIGDVVVPERWSEYLEAVFARKIANRYEVPRFFSKTLPNFGMIFPHPVAITHPGQVGPDYRVWFQADPYLLEVAQRTIANTKLSSCFQPDRCLPYLPKAIVGGNGVSGSAFVDNKEFRHWIYTTFHARAVDNESAAVAHVAYANGLPFIIFRSLSDLAGGDAKKNTMETFERLASNNSAALVLSFLEALPSQNQGAVSQP